MVYPPSCTVRIKLYSCFAHVRPVGVAIKNNVINTISAINITIPRRMPPNAQTTLELRLFAAACSLSMSLSKGSHSESGKSDLFFARSTISSREAWPPSSAIISSALALLIANRPSTRLGYESTSYLNLRSNILCPHYLYFYILKMNVIT